MHSQKYCDVCKAVRLVIAEVYTCSHCGQIYQPIPEFLFIKKMLSELRNDGITRATIERIGELAQTPGALQPLLQRLWEEWYSEDGVSGEAVKMAMEAIK